MENDIECRAPKIDIWIYILNSYPALYRSVNHLLGSKLLKDSRILLAF